MRRLVFIDDDAEELKSMREIVQEEYDYIPLHWPNQRPTKELVGTLPDIFVSDLYLPARDSSEERIQNGQRLSQRQVASQIADHFGKLYDLSLDDKELLRKTMDYLNDARKLLDMQWEALKQSPDNGLRLLADVKAGPEYGKVPFVFYSRKITPEDVIRVLQAGATDAIRKGYPESKSEAKKLVLFRLDQAQKLHSLQEASKVRTLNLNVNVTLFGGPALH